MYDGPKGQGFVPEVKIGNTVFSRQLTVEECPSKIDNMPSGLILVRVVVRWKSSDDRLPLVFEAVTTVADQW